MPSSIPAKLNLESAILSAVNSSLPTGKKNYALHEPFMKGNEWQYVKQCLDTGWVSSAGSFVNDFEKRLAEYTGVHRVIAVVNGTSALHISLQMAGVEQNDEVLVPALTFVATANAVAYCGAVPHFVDSDEITLGVDSLKLERELSKITEFRGTECFNKKTGRRIKALIAMHTFGHPVDLDPLAEICKNFKIDLIEDAAEALGSFYKGRHVGYAARFGILSFNGNKIITTGGGGAILSNDPKSADLARHISSTAKVPHPWSFEHDQLGYNYRMPNLNAALGLAQLENLEDFLLKKRALAEKYKKAFASINEIRFFEEPAFAKSNYWLNAVLLTPENQHKRDSILACLNENGIQARPAWTLMPKLSMYKNCPKMDLSTDEGIEARLINLPSSAFLS